MKSADQIEKRIAELYEMFVSYNTARPGTEDAKQNQTHCQREIALLEWVLRDEPHDKADARIWQNDEQRQRAVEARDALSEQLSVKLQ